MQINQFGCKLFQDLPSINKNSIHTHNKYFKNFFTLSFKIQAVLHLEMVPYIVVSISIIPKLDHSLALANILV